MIEASEEVEFRGIECLPQRKSCKAKLGVCVTDRQNGTDQNRTKENAKALLFQSGIRKAEGESTDGCLCVVVVAQMSAVRNGWSEVEWNGMEWTYPAGMGVVGGWGRDEWRMSKNKKGKGKYERNMSLPMPRFESPPKRPTQTGKLDIGKG